MHHVHLLQTEGEHPLITEIEGQISRVSAHWVLDMLYGLNHRPNFILASKL